MKQPINEIRRMQQLAGILKEYDEEGSGYSYEYQEGPGATPKEIKDTIDKYLKNKIAWEKLAKDDFEAMAQGERADVKSEYYPTWKMSDFKEVINAMENSNLNK